MKTAGEWLKQNYNDQFTHANIKHLAEMCEDYFQYAQQPQKVEQEVFQIFKAIEQYYETL